jgi:predicted HicB family RNase H-like nuclease
MTEEELKRMGRPPVENPATERLPMVRVTPEKLKAYKEAAEKEEISFSAWVRKSLDSAIKKNA